MAAIDPFGRLPGHRRSPPGLEHVIWRRLPAVLLWGTLVPMALGGMLHLTEPDPFGSDGRALTALDATQLRQDFLILGLIGLHWTVVLTVGLGCFIVRVMKGPAWVADAYPLPQAPLRPPG